MASYRESHTPLDATVGPVVLVLAAKRQYSPTLYPDDVTRAFVKLHEDLVAKTEATVLLAEESDHWVHLQQPDLIVQAIRIALGEQ